MVKCWNLFDVSVLKFVRLPKIDSTSFLTLYRRIYMDQNLFQPPSDVQGMKILNKAKFSKSIIVPCLYLPLKLIKDVKKPLNKYLLKIQNFIPITTPTQDFIEALKINGLNASPESCKMAIFDPRKVGVFRDMEEKDRLSLEDIGLNDNFMANTMLTLNYDNFKADEILRSVIPNEFESVSGYSLIGHIIHLNIRENLSEYKNIIAAVLLDKVKSARSVVNKIDKIDSTYRNFEMELLCGENNMIAKVRENKCVFELDFSKVYWNPRLCTEHERVVSHLEKNDVVYDVFCGVGPFSIPAAKKGCTVLANDLNPHSVEWLNVNIKLNKIGNNIEVFNKDGYQFIKQDIKQHLLKLNKGKCCSINIIMNLPASASKFLPAFQQLFSSDEMLIISSLPKIKVILYSFVKGDCDANEVVLKQISDDLGIQLTKEDEEVCDVFFVRDVAPKKKMLRVTLLLTDKIVLSKKRVNEIDEINPKRTCR